MIEFFSSMLTATWSLLTVYYVPVLIFYAIGGLVYTILKWYLDVFRLRNAVLNSNKIKANEQRILNETDQREIDSLNNLILNEKKLLSREWFDGLSYPPQLSDNKWTLFIRAVFWPLNLVWLLVGEIAIDIWTFIYAKTGKFFQSISDRILP